MRPGQESQTAVLVCMGRAAAHGATAVTRFQDPTAFALLPAEARARVTAFRAGVKPRGFRAAWKVAHLNRLSKMMVARTVAVDDAIRAAPSPQVVILGAGLDGRPWRMPELHDAIVFEVDHPDSQRNKRLRVASLSQAAREVRFVPMDFTRDSLDESLGAAAHDPSRPTTWVWEGVVMYLTPAEVEATLAVIAHRSAPGSRLVVVYHSPAFMLRIVGPLVRRLGEPLRSSYRTEEMRALLEKHRWRVSRDNDLPTIAAGLSSELVQATRWMTHTRIVIAVRVP